MAALAVVTLVLSACGASGSSAGGGRGSARLRVSTLARRMQDVGSARVVWTSTGTGPGWIYPSTESEGVVDLAHHRAVETVRNTKKDGTVDVVEYRQIGDALYQNGDDGGFGDVKGNPWVRRYEPWGTGAHHGRILRGGRRGGRRPRRDHQARDRERTRRDHDARPNRVEGADRTEAGGAWLHIPRHGFRAVGGRGRVDVPGRDGRGLPGREESQPQSDGVLRLRSGRVGERPVGGSGRGRPQLRAPEAGAHRCVDAGGSRRLRRRCVGRVPDEKWSCDLDVMGISLLYNCSGGEVGGDPSFPGPPPGVLPLPAPTVPSAAPPTST